MTSSRYIILNVVFCICASAKVVRAECGNATREGIKRVTFYGCCKLVTNEKSKEELEEEQEIFKMCDKEAIEISAKRPNSDDVPLASDGDNCFMECYLKKFGAMGENFEFIRDKMVEFYTKLYHKDFKEAGERAVNVCLSKNFTRKQCASGSIGVLWCLPVEMVMNCPAKVWTNSAKCNAARAYMKKCVPYRKHLLH